jgi:hypothetical protein
MSRATILRIRIVVVIGGVLGVLIYFAPSYFSATDAPPKYVKLITGGASVVYINHCGKSLEDPIP